MGYTELQVTTNFSFLRGASHPNELVEQAAAFGCQKIAITDRNTLAGVVRAHIAAKENKIKLIIGCRLDLFDGPSLLAYPTDKEAYARLSALLTLGNLRAEKGECHLYKADVYGYATGIKFIAIPPPMLNELFDFEPSFADALQGYRHKLGTNLYLGMARSYQGDDHKKLHRLSLLSARFDIPLVALNDVHYHEPGRRELQDIFTCVREKCTITAAGFLLHQNAERHLKPIEEMERLFRQYPEAISNTQVIAGACTFSLDELNYVYPRRDLR